MGKYDAESSTMFSGGVTESAPASSDKYLPSVAAPSPAGAPPGVNRTWGDTLRGVGQTAVDFATAAGHSGTFGLDVRRDALAGWLAGDYPSYSAGVEAEQRKLAKQRERSPYASIAGDVAGAAMLPSMGGAGLAARLGGGWGARALGYGAEGAALGAAQGAGTTYTGKPLDYLTSAGTGGAIGGVLGAGMGSIFGPRGGMRSTAEVPSTDRLYREKGANYRELENQPVRYEAQALADASIHPERTLRRDRFHESTSPVSFQALDEMRGAPTAFPLGRGTPVTPGDIEFIRKGQNQISPVTGGPDIAAQRHVKRALDDFILNPPQGAVMPGMEAAAREATAIAERARGNHGAYRRGEFFDDILNNAQNTAGSTYSGLNLQNFARQGVRSALRQTKGESPASKVGMNDDEIAALTRFARVPLGDGTLRYFDRLMGGGGGLGAVVAGGTAGGAASQYLADNPTWGGLAGVAIPAAGLGLRLLGNRRAMQNMNDLGDMIRQRSPLYQERAATAPMVQPPGGGTTASARDAMTLELLRLQERGVPRITVTPRDPREE